MSANYTVSIEPDVRVVLENSVIAGTSLTLPPGQLDRKLYERVNKVLELAGGKWNRKSKSHIFPDDPKPRLGLALDMGAIVDTKKEKQQFFTPDDLADRLVSCVDVRAGQLVLEPSAGAGAIAAAIVRAGAQVSCVELDETLVATLRAYGFNTKSLNFLLLEPMKVYDRVVMNPPFTKGQDIQHVLHALKFLKLGGLLVSVMGAGIKSNTSKAATAFRTLVEDRGGYFENLPPESFKESGTNVNTVMVVIPGA